MDEEIPYNELLLDVEDGIVVGLYHYLWLKDAKGRACPEVNVPHTIIISNGRPKVWYFTSGKERCVKRKNRANITNATIAEALAPRPPKQPSGFSNSNANSHSYSASGASAANAGASTDPNSALLGAWGNNHSAVQMQQQGSPSAGNKRAKSADPRDGRAIDGNSTGTALGPWPHHGVVARFQGSMTNPQNAGGTSHRGASLGRKKKGAQFELQDEYVEFFTREQLSEILPPGHSVVHGVAALHEGVLQRFVQSRAQHHFSIRATWSPNACVVERRTCKAKLNDPRVSLGDRLAAWDGPNWLSEHTLITGTVLHGSICRLCDNVAAHLADVSGGGVRVLRMVLFFCVDEANRIWLTHCGTLKTERLREFVMAPRYGVSGALMQELASRRASHAGRVPPLLPTPSTGLRLRNPDGSLDKGVSGGALSGQNSLDLPAPAASFAATKSAAAAIGTTDHGTDGISTPRDRFLCVLTGEMYPSSQRCDVTYKQLLQHWFSLASQLPHEGDRLRAMDTIPLAIRRANPSLTREWYLRVRSQPTFLYRTAPVCLEAAGQITGMALEELHRTLAPSPSTMAVQHGTGAGGGGGGGAAGGAASPGAASPGGGGNGMLSGWVGAAPGTHGASTVAVRGAPLEGLSRQTTGNTTARAQLSGVHSFRQRPATALPPTGPSSQLLQHQPSAVLRTAHRQLQGQLPMSVPGVQLPPGSVPSWKFKNRSKSASPSLAVSRLPPTVSCSGIGGGGSSFPSMLLPRERSTGTVAGPIRGPCFLQVYGPTPEQAAEAAAAAAILPYEVLDEARQQAVADPEGGPTAATLGGGTRANHLVGHNGQDHVNKHVEEENSNGVVDDDVEEGGGPRGTGAGESVDSANAATGSAAASQDSHVASGNVPQHLTPLTSSQPYSARCSGTAGGGGGGGGPASTRISSSYSTAVAAVTGSSHGGVSAVVSSTAPSRSNRLPGRMSTSSEITEMGSVASFSEPSSPNGTHPGYLQLHGHAHLAGGHAAVGPPQPQPQPSRMSPPRSVGVPTLHTIHEEGAVAGAPPPPTSLRISTGRSGSPMATSDTAFSPASRGGGVPRMRPPARDRSGLGVSSSRRPPSGAPPMHGHVSGTASGFERESIDPSASSAYGGGAAAAIAASLNSTMASSVGSLSRRSTNNQGVLSNEDMRTLRELNDAYSAAEKLTQQLLAQAHVILSEDGGSRPGSTGTSPLHGGRRSAASPRGNTPSRPGTGNSGITPLGWARQASSTGSGTGALTRVSSGSGKQGVTAVQHGPGLGPSPLGQREGPSSRKGLVGESVSERVAAGGSGSSAGEVVADQGYAVAPAAAAAAAATAASDGDGSVGSGGQVVRDVLRTSEPGSGFLMGVLTPAEADMLDWALREAMSLNEPDGQCV